MDIYVFDGPSHIIGIISSFKSCIWDVQYNGQDEFNLVVNATDDNLKLLKPGNFLARSTDKFLGSFENVMAIQNIVLDFDVDSGWILTVSGKGLKNEILRKRIIWSQLNYDNDYVWEVIKDVIEKNVEMPDDDDRRIPELFFQKVGQDAIYTDRISCQLFGDNIAEWMESICKAYNYGWRCRFNEDNYQMQLYQGKDRTYSQNERMPVVFSPEFDNLLSSSYTENINTFKNVALVGGEGEGTNQRTVSVGSGSGMDRNEVYIDGKSVSSNGEIITPEKYLQLLSDYGQTQLDQTTDTTNFSGSIKYDGVYKINKDYSLGDLVQIENQKGMKAVTRITEIIYAEDENGVSVVPTFSEWEVN